jgi:hypothetical protein
VSAARGASRLLPASSILRRWRLPTCWLGKLEGSLAKSPPSAPVPCLACCRGEWERIGEVVGGPQDNVAGGGSKWHNGQLWDFGERWAGRGDALLG